MTAAMMSKRDLVAERRALADELARPALRSIRLSRVLVLLLFVGLVLLAMLVPIASGTLATGQVGVEGERKVVQHASGGIVAAILAKEGDVVQAGDIVLRLDPIQAGAAAGVIGAQIDSLRAEEAVRIAESTGASAVAFPPELISREGDPAVSAALRSEETAFEARRALARSQASQLDDQLAQIDQSVSAASSERIALEAQAKLFEEELSGLQPLLEKGLALKSRVLGLQRSLEDARGRIASLDAEAKRLAAKSSETRAMRARIEFDRRAEAAEALRKLRADLAAALDKQLAADDTLKRTDVLAPTGGVVMAVRVTTVGGVIEPGQPLMEIVPQSRSLIVRARVHPKDADDIRQGMDATVRLSAGGARSPPRVEGTVQSISADALTNSRTEEPYFEVRIAIPLTEIDKVPADVLAPGLPAEVLIKTGEHTVFDYLFAPIERAMFQTMRDR